MGHIIATRRLTFSLGRYKTDGKIITIVSGLTKIAAFYIMYLIYYMKIIINYLVVYITTQNIKNKYVSVMERSTFVTHLIKTSAKY